MCKCTPEIKTKFCQHCAFPEHTKIDKPPIKPPLCKSKVAKRLVWYHGTTSDALKKIQQEGVLFGVRNTPSRCTYLAADLSTAKQYGDVILQVNYNPSGGDNNYCDDCWQMRVYEPIPIKNITILTRDVNV